MRGIHRWPVNSPHKGPVTRKMLPFDDVIMLSSYAAGTCILDSVKWEDTWMNISLLILRLAKPITIHPAVYLTWYYRKWFEIRNPLYERNIALKTCIHVRIQYIINSMNCNTIYGMNMHFFQIVSAACRHQLTMKFSNDLSTVSVKESRKRLRTINWHQLDYPN